MHLNDVFSKLFIFFSFLQLCDYVTLPYFFFLLFRDFTRSEFEAKIFKSSLKYLKCTPECFFKPVLLSECLIYFLAMLQNSQISSIGMMDKKHHNKTHVAINWNGISMQCFSKYNSLYSLVYRPYLLIPHLVIYDQFQLECQRRK